MTNDHNDLVPSQEKLEWVTPKISLMGTGDTNGKVFDALELTKWCPQTWIAASSPNNGPS